MESVDGRVLTGEFSHPVVNDNTPYIHPKDRNYFQPPTIEKLTKRSYPITDYRPLLSHEGQNLNDMLNQYGFGIVKHESEFVKMLDGPVDDNIVPEVYYPEVRKLVQDTLGAKTVFVTIVALRLGKRDAEQYVVPTGIGNVCDARLDDGAHVLAKQPNLGLGKPIRMPHLDYTPLGARQEIRNRNEETVKAALDSGVIQREDEICKEHKVSSATIRESDPVIAQNYNKNGEFGPRYAAYSVWRPLKPVGRDPITMLPRKELQHEKGEKYHWPFESRYPGTEKLGGDWIKEVAMLGVKASEPAPGEAADKDEAWYYLSNQQPDEVLMMKLFDSTSLGTGFAGAPWHGSPEIGLVEGSAPRESIEVRVLAFW